MSDYSIRILHEIKNNGDNIYVLVPKVDQIVNENYFNYASNTQHPKESGYIDSITGALTNAFIYAGKPLKFAASSIVGMFYSTEKKIPIRTLSNHIVNPFGGIHDRQEHITCENCNKALSNNSRGYHNMCLDCYGSIISKSIEEDKVDINEYEAKVTYKLNSGS